MEGHARRILATTIALGFLIFFGAWLFKAPTSSLHHGLAWFEESKDNETSADILIFPNATALISLTIKKPITALLTIEGTGTDILLGLNGEQIQSTEGTLYQNTYQVSSGAITTLSLDNDMDQDLNNNRFPDQYELRHTLNLNMIDPDRDNLTTRQELNYFLDTGRQINPLVSDTDGDGINDGAEVNIGTDPTDPEDAPLHGFANEPWFFTFNNLFSQGDLEAIWSFDATHSDALARHPISLLENTTITPGLFGLGLNISLQSLGARARPSPVFQRLHSFTLSAWVMTNDNRSRYILSIPSEEGKPAIAMDFGSSKPSCTITINNRTTSSKTKHSRMLSDNKPHHITCVKNQTSLTLYVDGTFDESIEAEPFAPDAGGYLFFGNHNSQDRFNGIIDLVLLYREPLPSEAIVSQYAAFHDGIDQDQDGMSDAWEEHHGLSWKVPSDSRRDDDSDGLINIQEYQYYFLTGRELNPKKSDTDGDGYSDFFETRSGSNPTDPSSQPGYHQSPHSDFNHDGIPDSFELAFGLSITEPVADQDPDKDGLTNLEEYNYFAHSGRLIHPLMADSDQDGSPDKEEIEKEEDPSGKKETIFTIPMPGRFHIDLPSQAIIERAAVRFSQPVNITTAGAMNWSAQGLADISSLMNTTCHHPMCRQEFIVSGPRHATISDIDIRYSLSPIPVEGTKLCKTYPCTIPVSLRSKTPGTVRVSLTNVTLCQHDCESQTTLPRAPQATGFTTARYNLQKNDVRILGLLFIIVSLAAGIGILIAGFV